jgi:hypothetical protein
MEPELTKLLRTAQHQIETPGDFTADETKWLLEDLGRALGDIPAPGVVLPIVHRNGTSKEELLCQRIELSGALRQAEAKLRQAAPNGRDYYPVPGLYEKALAQHARRLETFRELGVEVATEFNGIDEQG